MTGQDTHVQTTCSLQAIARARLYLFTTLTDTDGRTAAISDARHTGATAR